MKSNLNKKRQVIVFQFTSDLILTLISSNNRTNQEVFRKLNRIFCRWWAMWWWWGTRESTWPASSPWRCLCCCRCLWWWWPWSWFMMYLMTVENKRKKLTCLITLKVFVLLMNDNGHGNDMLYQVQDIFPSILSKMIWLRYCYALENRLADTSVGIKDAVYACKDWHVM